MNNSIRGAKPSANAGNNLSHSAIFRVLFAVMAPLSLVALLRFYYIFYEYFACPWHKLTGLYCFGCGSGRALTSLLALDIPAALRHNAFSVIAIILIGYYFVKIYIRIVTGRDLLPFFRISIRTCNITAILLILFMILRNIPYAPFTLLVP